MTTKRTQFPFHELVDQYRHATSSMGCYALPELASSLLRWAELVRHYAQFTLWARKTYCGWPYFFTGIASA